jgi:methionyl-tRNA formyltransferase
MLVIAGKNNIAVKVFDYIYEHYGQDFLVVCNKTDSGEHGWQRSLRKTAIEKGVREVTLAEAYDLASIFISLEFDTIVKPQKFRDALAYNIHFSLLPKYKGMYTSTWPLLNGEASSGVSLHKIDHGIDTGDLIDQLVVPIFDDDRAINLYMRYLDAGFSLFKANIKKIFLQSYLVTKQSSHGSTYFSKSSIDFHEVKIDLNQTADGIKRQIYAFSFRRYQLAVVHSETVVHAEILSNHSVKKPGSIIHKSSNFFDISTIDYDLRLYLDEIKNIHDFAKCDVSHARKLLLNLCGIDDCNDYGWSPLIIAAYNGNFNVVKFLVDSGANINAVNNNGTSVLMYAKDFALENQDKRGFEFLIKNGAEISHRDFSGRQLTDYISQSDAEFLGLEKW